MGFITFVWCGLCVLLSSLCLADDYERRLYERLLTNYNVLERPVENNSMLVEVKLQIVLNQVRPSLFREFVCDYTTSILDNRRGKGTALIDLASSPEYRRSYFQDEKNQVIQTNLWLKYVRASDPESIQT